MLKFPKRRSLRRETRGAALIEFSYTLPVFVFLMLGGMELVSLALAHLKVSSAAETLADNASRVRVQMDENDIDQIFMGVDQQGKSIDLKGKGRAVISSVQDNGKTGAANGQTIRWQRCDGAKTAKAPKYGKEGKGQSDASLKNGIGSAGRQIKPQLGTAIMFAEVSYDYDPVIFGGLFGQREIRYEAAFNVRERTELGITNVKSKAKKTC